MAVTATPPAAPPVTEPPSPYPGLRPFTEKDAPFFFGRASEVEIVAANFLSSRLTLVYGASGVGKTSVLLAGVVNTLRRQAAANLDDEDEFNDFAVLVMSAWADPEPNKAIAAAARAEVGGLLGRNDLPDPPDGATLAAVLEHWSGQLGGKLLVVFDQFEEYFRYHEDERRAGTFDAEFPQAVNGVDVPVHFLLSVRDDELARLDHFKGRIPKLFDNRVKIDHLTCPSAERAIRRPLDKLPAEHHVGIEDELVSALLANCAVRDAAVIPDGESSDDGTSAAKAPTGSVKAPLLQLVLERLWRSAADTGAQMLTLAQLKALGGVEGILDTHLHSALDALAPAEQDIAAKCFGLLVSPTKTKMAFPASILTRVAGRDDEREVTDVLDTLCSAESGHILNAVDTGQDGGSKSYELSNADLLAEPIIAWQKEHDEAQRRKAEEARRLAIRRKYRNRSIILVTLVVIFAALGAWAWVQRNDAKRAARSAASVALASTANAQLASHRDVALLLSLEAYRRQSPPTPQAKSSLLEAFRSVQRDGLKILRGNQGGVTGVVYSKDGSTLAVAGSDGTVQLWDKAGPRGEPLDGKHGAVTAVALSDQTLAAGYSDGWVLLWDMKSRAARAPTGHRSKGAVTALAFSRNGRTLAGADSAGRVRIWSKGSAKGKWIQSRQLLKAAGISGMALSADGEALVAAQAGKGDTRGGAIQIWDLNDEKKWESLITLPVPHSGKRAITAIALSKDRDESTLAVALANDPYHDPPLPATVVLWDGEDTGKSRSYDKSGVSDIAFSPDGKMFASAGGDGSVHLFDVRGLELSPHGTPLRGQQGPVSGVAFNGKGTLAAAYDDGTVLLWNIDSRAGSGVYRRLGKGGYTIAVNSDATRFATDDFDGNVQVWDQQGKKAGRPLIPDYEWAFGFSPEGRTLAIIGLDAVELWRERNAGLRKKGAPGFAKLGAVRGLGGNDTMAVAFSPDGRQLATADYHGGVQFWDWDRNRPTVPARKQIDQGAVTAIAFSPDAKMFATAHANGTVLLWDAKNRTRLGKPLYVRKHGVTGIAFSPDGNTLATAGTNGTRLLWNISDIGKGKPTPPPQLLKGNQGRVNGVAFSLNDKGRTLASAGEDGTVVLYDRVEHTQQVLRGDQGRVYGVAFLGDGSLVATGSEGTVLWTKANIKTWDSLAAVKRDVCALVTGNLTQDQWAALAPSQVPYSETCPDSPASSAGATSG